MSGFLSGTGANLAESRSIRRIVPLSCLACGTPKTAALIRCSATTSVGSEPPSTRPVANLYEETRCAQWRLRRPGIGNARPVVVMLLSPSPPRPRYQSATTPPRSSGGVERRRLQDDSLETRRNGQVHRPAAPRSISPGRRQERALRDRGSECSAVLDTLGRREELAVLAAHRSTDRRAGLLPPPRRPGDGMRASTRSCPRCSRGGRGRARDHRQRRHGPGRRAPRLRQEVLPPVPRPRLPDLRDPRQRRLVRRPPRLHVAHLRHRRAAGTARGRAGDQGEDRARSLAPHDAPRRPDAR